MMKLLRKNRGQYDQAVFYIVVIWLLASIFVFSKEFMMENDWKMAGILLTINAATVVSSFITFYGYFADFSVSAISTAIYVLSVYRFDRCMLNRNITELIFMAVLPLMFYVLYRTENGESRSAVILGICGLILAVLGTEVLEVAVITLIITACLVFFLNRKGKSLLQIGIAVGIACVAGGALGFSEMKNPDNFSLIQTKGLQLSGLLVEFWKIKSKTPGLEEDALYGEPLGIGFFTLAGMGIFLVLWLLGHITFREEGANAVIGAVAITAVLELAMTLRSFPWDRIQYINGVTYRVVGNLKTPAAFLTPVIFSCALIWGYLLARYKKKKDFFYIICVTSAIIGIIVSGIYVRDVNNFTVDYQEMLQMQSGLETE